MSKHVLITGASGFLGKIIVDYLSQPALDYCVDTLGRSTSATYNTDLSNDVPALEKKYNIIIHAAGKAHVVPTSAAEEAAFFNVNVEGTKNLCKAFTTTEKPDAFIFISTVAVYGVDAGQLISEDAPLNGSTPYARSKIMAEEWLQEWAIQNQVQLTILRLPLIAGPNPPGNLGDMLRGIKSGHYFSIGKADARKSVVWAADIAAVIPIVAKVGGVFNLTDRHHPSFAELETCIAAALHRKSPKRIPLVAAQSLAAFGDLVGKRFPINSHKLRKILSPLTFDDRKAGKLIQWNPSNVIEKLPTIL
ncbi:nucleoside-diphosphate-sugar epimerase [Chitinophaga niastensis]|uniref:Nucleoside-diphosphate-sugar epimerase n=1 Tax=Chitinophaga niastensis TaxID=536980 RepID=A0A2P8HFC5_CHINA|nr:NAD-dependent epimerase/dehydratase family protein [Chitinophaga niastensis]PSL44905.1 nucleoside-diphosphate-sugar epimerase [Chitinophaga niastensis]